MYFDIEESAGWASVEAVAKGQGRSSEMVSSEKGNAESNAGGQF